MGGGGQPSSNSCQWLHLFSFYPLSQEGKQTQSLPPPPTSRPHCSSLFLFGVSQRSICLIFPSLHCFSLNWETGMRAEEELKLNPSEGERWKCQGIYLTCQLDISSKCRLMSHFFFLLVSFNLIDCVAINCLYVWGERSVHSEFMLAI